MIAAYEKRGIHPKKITALYYSGIPSWLTDLDKYDFVEYKKCDLSGNDVLLLEEHDIIIHSAGYGQPSKFLKQQVKAFSINTWGTRALLDKLTEGGKFLFLSSCSVYTGCEDRVFTEASIGKTNTDHPRICYIEGKRAGEALVNIYRNTQGIDAKSIRISYTYGPGVKKNDARAMYNFIDKGTKGNIALLDRGLARHTYCYIVDGMIMAWNVLRNGKHSTYNIAGVEDVTIRELAQIIGDIMGVSIEVPEKNDNEIVGAQTYEPIGIERVKEEFNIQDKDFVKLKTGLVNTVKWYTQKR